MLMSEAKEKLDTKKIEKKPLGLAVSGSDEHIQGESEMIESYAVMRQ